jgi:hypothetical protein
MMAILHALKKWHPYLIGRHFKVKIDHDSLKYFLEQRLSSEEQQKWVIKILGYDFETVYKKGVITLNCTTHAYLASGQLISLPFQSHAE